MNAYESWLMRQEEARFEEEWVERDPQEREDEYE